MVHVYGSCKDMCLCVVLYMYNMWMCLQDCACDYLHAFQFAANCMFLHCSYKESCTCTLLAGISCGPAPDAPANGQQISSGTTIGSTVSYTCNRGYNLQGDSRRTCMANGYWSGRASTCDRKLLCSQMLCKPMFHYRYIWTLSPAKSICLSCKGLSGQCCCSVITVRNWPRLYRNWANKQQVERQYSYTTR